MLIRVVRVLVDYVEILLRAVNPGRSVLLTDRGRIAVYRHARERAERTLRRYAPPLSEDEINRELAKLYAAIQHVESRMLGKQGKPE